MGILNTVPEDNVTAYAQNVRNIDRVRLPQ